MNKTDAATLLIELTPEQREYLNEKKNKLGIRRFKVLSYMISQMQVEDSVFTKRGVSVCVPFGMIALSEASIGRAIGMGRNAARKIIAEFNSLGIIESRKNYIISLYVMKCVKGLRCNNMIQLNPMSR